MTTTALRIQLVSCPSEFALLKDEWTELLEHCESGHFFLSWQWLYYWWLHLSERRDLRLLLVRDGERLVGIAPFCIQPTQLSIQPSLRKVEFLGSGTAGSDYLDILARRGWEERVLDLLAEELSSAKLGFSLVRMAAGQALALQLVERLRRYGWMSSSELDETCPYIPLLGHSWDSYLGSLGRQHRASFKRKWRRLQDFGEVRFVCERPHTEREEALKILFELHHARWRDRGTSEAFCTESLKKFHNDVGQQAESAGWLRHYILYMGNEAAATLYGFKYANRFSFFQSGFNPDFASWSLGLVIMGLAIRAQIEEGTSEFDLLHGTEPYKFHWTKNTRDLTRLLITPPGLRGTLHQRGMNLDKQARQTARRIINASRTILFANDREAG